MHRKRPYEVVRLGKKVLRDAWRDEGGLAVAVVTLVGVALMLLTAIVVARAVSQNNFTVSDRGWEEAFIVAETGAHQGIFDVDEDLQLGTSNVPDVTYDPTFGGKTEKQWAIDQADSLTAQSTPEGDFAFFTVSALPALYSVGYTPSKDHPLRLERVMRIDYIESTPTQSLGYALLVNGDLEFDEDSEDINAGAVVIDGNLHANGRVVAYPNPPLPNVTGDASATGTISNVDVDGTTTPGAPSQPMPQIEPRAYFPQAEYVLCPDGSVYRGPANGGVATTPCSDPADLLSAAPYLGWAHTWDPTEMESTWDHSGSSVTDGVYYAYQSEMTVSGSKSSAWNVTLISEDDSGTCEEELGAVNIEYPDSGTLTLNARAGDLLLMATGEFDIDDGDGTAVLNGIVVVDGEAEIEVGAGALSINGPVIARGLCDEDDDSVEIESEDGNGDITITYNGGMSLDTTGSPTVTIQTQVEL